MSYEKPTWTLLPGAIEWFGRSDHSTLPSSPLWLVSVKAFLSVGKAPISKLTLAAALSRDRRGGGRWGGDGGHSTDPAAGIGGVAGGRGNSQWYTGGGG